MIRISEKTYQIEDYILENGIALYGSDWNGELYKEGWDIKNRCVVKKEYKPVYRFETDNIDINKLEENSDEWIKADEVVGFKEM